MFILANGHAPDDYRVYTDVGNQNISTPMSLYSFYEDVSGESVQVSTVMIGRMYCIKPLMEDPSATK